jgi:hypothetical protein
MNTVLNMATERARRDTDRVLDAVDQIRGELESAPHDETASRLCELADRLAQVGITMLAATAVMAEDFEQRLQAPRATAKSPRRCGVRTAASALDQRSML